MPSEALLDMYSGILGLASEFATWNNPMGLDVPGERGKFCLLVWMVLILGVGDCGGCR